MSSHSATPGATADAVAAKSSPLAAAAVADATVAADAADATAAADFLPAASFQGSKEGYAFTNGAKGLGYYRDLPSDAPEPFALDNSEVWMYFGAGQSSADTNAAANGPVTLQQLRESDPAVAALVWKPGLASWTPRAEAMELQQWFYLDPKKAAVGGGGAPQAGPFWVEQLAKLYNDGAVDRLTQLWREGMDSWKPLIELADLETFLDGIVAQAAPPAPSLEDAAAAQAAAQLPGQGGQGGAGQAGGDGADKRKITEVYQGPAEGEAQSYVAEDGTQYAWDDQSKKWIKALTTAADGEAGAAGAAEGGGDAAPAAKRKRKKKKKKKKARPANESSVYVTGLDPETVDEEELEQLFSKYGIIKTSIFTGGPSITVYRTHDGTPKGDATVAFLMPASVSLATRLADGMEYRPGFTLAVKKAEWDKGSSGDKGGGDAGGGAAGAGSNKAAKKSKPQYQLTQAEMKQLQKQIAARERKALSWADGPEDDDMNIVILKHCFEPREIEDEEAEADVKKDLREGCEQVGTVLKVSLMKFNPEGVAIVKFEDAATAEACVERMNGRYFGRRPLEAHLWDGVTVYYVKESEESKKRRLEDFGKFLEGGGDGDGSDDKKAAAAATAAATTRAGVAPTGSGGARGADAAAAAAAAPLPALSPAGQAVATAAEELLATATDSMLESFITSAQVADIKALVASTRAWLRANPSPAAAEAAQKKTALTDNPIIAGVLAAMG